MGAPRTCPSFLPSFCSYEPELFPGLIYRMVKPRIVLLIFVSGKVVLTGTLTFSHTSVTLVPVCTPV